MRRLILTAGLLFLSSRVSAETFETLLSSCKAVADARVRSEKVTLPQDFESGVCWGAFSVFQGVIVVADQNGHRIFGVCTPSKSTRTQEIAVFVEFARRNPQRLHEEAFDVVLDALRKAFPCS